MSKLLSVVQLQVGDRFEFVAFRDDKFADSPSKDHPDMMVVANVPKVNHAAGSCFFRYKAESNPVEFRSWNGTTDIEVRLFSDRALTPAPSAPPKHVAAALAPPQSRAAEPATNGHAAAAKLTAPVAAAAPLSLDDLVVDLGAEPSADDAAESDDTVPAKPTRKRAAAAKKTPKAAAADEPEKKTTLKKIPAKQMLKISSATAKPAIEKPVAEKSATARPAAKKAIKPAVKKKA